jgi:hypothetical protein
MNADPGQAGEGSTPEPPALQPPIPAELRAAGELPRISGEEILAGDPVLRWLSNRVGFGNWRQVVTLVGAITLPCLVFAFVAAREGRLWLESLAPAQQVEGQEVVVLGMSFLGDPMVWPFFFLVPLTVLLFKNATKKLADFFYEVRAVVDPGWAAQYSDDYQRLVDETQGCLAARGAWRWGPRAAVAVALSFWLYNGLTCSLPQLNAYHSDRVTVREADTWQEVLVPERFMIPEMAIPKWDADFDAAPLCWVSARLWTLFGYGVVPFVLARLLAMVVALSFFSRRLIRADALNIQPLAADRSGGLSCLADAALAVIYTLMPILLMVFIAFFKEGTPPSPHNYLLMGAFLPVIMVAFGVPVSTVHAAMERTKRRFLTRISHRFNLLNQDLLHHLESGQPDRDHIKTLESSLQTLQGLYQQTEKMPVWPFELSRGLQFTGALLAPLVLTVLELASEPLVERLFK